MISLDEINFNIPFKLIHPNLKTIEVITDINYLNLQSSLNVKNQSLRGCVVEDIYHNYYVIYEIVVLGKKNSWWKFEYFNPMLKVKLNLVKVEEVDILQKLNKLSKIPNIEILEGRYEPNYSSSIDSSDPEPLI
jgi:hypothetical protein